MLRVSKLKLESRAVGGEEIASWNGTWLEIVLVGLRKFKRGVTEREDED
jgi:hypothetical protein